MSHPFKMFLVLLLAAFILIGSSSAASAYKRKPDTTNSRVTVPSSPATDQHPSPIIKTEPQASTYKTLSTLQSHSRFKQSHHSDISLASNADSPALTQQNDTITASTTDSGAVPSDRRTLMPTLGTTVNSVVHVIIMILGFLNININLRVHGEWDDRIPEDT